jgi:hypothetical protein
LKPSPEPGADPSADIVGAAILRVTPHHSQVELGTIGLLLLVLHGSTSLLTTPLIARIDFATSSCQPEYGFLHVAGLFRGCWARAREPARQMFADVSARV